MLVLLDFQLELHEDIYPAFGPEVMSSLVMTWDITDWGKRQSLKRQTDASTRCSLMTGTWNPPQDLIINHSMAAKQR